MSKSRMQLKFKAIYTIAYKQRESTGFIGGGKTLLIITFGIL